MKNHVHVSKKMNAKFSRINYVTNSKYYFPYHHKHQCWNHKKHLSINWMKILIICIVFFVTITTMMYIQHFDDIHNDQIYVIKNRINGGGQGIIYSVQNQNDGKYYIMKKCRSKNFDCQEIWDEYQILLRLMNTSTTKKKLFPFVHDFSCSVSDQCMFIMDLISNTTDLENLSKHMNISIRNVNDILSSLVDCYDDIENTLSIIFQNDIYLNDFHRKNVLYQYTNGLDKSQCYLIDFGVVFELKTYLEDKQYTGVSIYFSAYAWYNLMDPLKRQRMTVDETKYFGKMDNIYQAVVMILDTFIDTLLTVRNVNNRNKDIHNLRKTVRHLRNNGCPQRYSVNYVDNGAEVVPPLCLQRIWCLRVLMRETIQLILTDMYVEDKLKDKFTHMLNVINTHYEWQQHQNINKEC
eukprot:499002_1